MSIIFTELEMSDFPAWFDSEYYAEQKVLQMNTMKYALEWLKDNFNGAKKWTLQSYEKHLSEYLLDGKHITAYDNFLACNTSNYNLTLQYPYVDITDINVSCNKYFDIPVYIQNLTNFFNTNEFYTEDHKIGEWTHDATIQYLYKDLHMSAWEHYKVFGLINQINPSNEFDTSAYLEARAEKSDCAVDDVIEDLLADDLNPIMDYYDFGMKNDIEISPVASPVTPDIPQNWTPWGYVDNPQIPDTPDIGTPDASQKPVIPNTPQNPNNPNDSESGNPQDPVIPNDPQNPVIEPDRFEVVGNDSPTEATVLTTSSGALNDLTITDGDQDWYKISLDKTGTADNFVQINFEQTDKSFNFELHDTSGNIVTGQSVTTGTGQISLANLAPGDYFAVISGKDNATGSYSLEWNADSSSDNPELPEEPGNSDYNIEFAGHGSSVFGDDLIVFTLYMKGYLPDDYPMPDAENFTIRSKDHVGKVTSIVRDIEHGQIKIYAEREPVHSTAHGGALLEYNPAVTGDDNMLGKMIADYFYDAYQNGHMMNSFTLNSPHFDGQANGNVINLGIAFENDVDYFEFTIDRKQTNNDYIKINFNHDDGDLNAILYKYESLYEDGKFKDEPIYYATSQTDNEIIKLNNLIPTWEGGKETYRLKVFGKDNATNDYTIEYQVNSGMPVGDFTQAIDYGPTISNMPTNIGMSKEMLINSAVGIKDIHLPNINIIDSPYDPLTVTLESKESRFIYPDYYNNLFVTSNDGHKIVFKGLPEDCNELLKLVNLEPTATAISKLNGDVNPFMTVDISVSDGKHETSGCFSYRSDNFIASYIEVPGEATDVSGPEHIYVNGITKDGIIAFQHQLSYTDDSIFDADKVHKQVDGNMCWAATASDILAWTGWGEVIRNVQNIDGEANNHENDIEDMIFSRFKEAFANDSGYIGDAIQWFFDGSEGNLTETVPGKGNLLHQAADVSLLDIANINNMNTLASELRSGSGVGLSIHTASGDSGHALTCWGYAYNSGLSRTDPNYYTGLIISDSNDRIGSNVASLEKWSDTMKYIAIEWSDEAQRYIIQDQNINHNGDPYLIYTATVLPQMNSESTPLAEYGALPFHIDEIPVAGYRVP